MAEGGETVKPVKTENEDEIDPAKLDLSKNIAR